ncbi:TetR/AcrR family transcriptional regulator [Nocardioides sp.]|uniref:TetR/AcrR family transcriptional regulator n=1 Tax=Nocardioides sp. TaxID=35761 RepID=UPI003563C80F
MGHHGWQGDPPRTEELARERIIAATTRCIERLGVPRTTLSSVAEEVGVTRQTVYRYFANMGELLSAVAEAGATDFIERMTAHLSAATTPLEAVTESIVFAVQEIPREPSIGLLLQADDRELFGRGVTSAAALGLGGQVLRDLAIDWESVGVRDEELDSLAEITMRLMLSLLLDPSATPRSADDLRAFVGRWLGPALSPRR